MRLLVLTLGVLIALAIGYMATYMWGNSQVYAPFQSNYFKEGEKLRMIQWEQTHLLPKMPDLILWVDVYRNPQGQILVKPWADRHLPKARLPQDSSVSRPLLTDLLAQFPNSRWVINCNDNTQDIQITLSKILTDAKLDGRVLIQSNYSPIMESLKDMHPMVVYGSSIADITRLKTFDAMGLLAAAPFKGDVLMTPLTYLNRPTINHEIIREMKRRFKKVILGPLMSDEEVRYAESLEPDGLFIADPLLLPR